MIVVRLSGGMGNQMFEYALGRALSLRYNVPFKLDTSEFKTKNPPAERVYALDMFNIEENLAQENEIPLIYRNHLDGKIYSNLLKLLRKIIRSKGRERFFHFDQNVFSSGPDVYLRGYWQSPKYFQEIGDIIKKDFTAKKQLPPNIQELMTEIKNQNSLCIHVRRGDYVGNSFHETVDKEYYYKGLEKIESFTTIDKIFVFSNDIKWCEENMSFPYPAVFVGNEYSGEKDEGNLFLMSACRHFIIPNSTFSWWAAWLSTGEDKRVIMPKRWLNDKNIDTSDIVPENWIQI